MSGGEFFDVTRDNVLYYDPETITLAAGQVMEMPGSNSFIEALSATADTVSVSLNGRYFFALPIGLILKAPQGKGFRRLYVKNTGGAANVITIAKGLGDFGDNRLVLSASSVLNVNPVPTAYGARFRLTAVAGSALATGTIVAAGSNVNGILITSAMVLCGQDPTGNAQLGDATTYFLEAMDSQALSLGSQITIPAGSAFVYATTGLCRINGTYRIL